MDSFTTGTNHLTWILTTLHLDFAEQIESLELIEHQKLFRLYANTNP